MGSRSLARIADGPIIDQLNAAWLAAYPHQAQPLVPASLNDDGMLLWFSNGDRTALADQFATAFLQRYAGSGTGGDVHRHRQAAGGVPLRRPAQALRRAGRRAVRRHLRGRHPGARPDRRRPARRGLHEQDQEDRRARR